LCKMRNLGILVLDEIESDGPSEFSINLYKNIIEKENFEQIFCITHNSETQDYLLNNYDAERFHLVDGKIKKFVFKSEEIVEDRIIKNV